MVEGGREGGRRSGREGEGREGRGYGDFNFRLDFAAVVKGGGREGRREGGGLEEGGGGGLTNPNHFNPNLTPIFEVVWCALKRKVVPPFKMYYFANSKLSLI